jgi:hypothetical protein
MYTHYSLQLFEYQTIPGSNPEEPGQVHHTASCAQLPQLVLGPGGLQHTTSGWTKEVPENYF